MPAALDRLLTCPAALRTVGLQCCRPARAARSFSSVAARLRAPEHGLATKIHHLNHRKGIWRFTPTVRELNVDEAETASSDQPNINNAPASEQAASWAETLLYRERVYGLKGVRELFVAMVRRGYQLPTEDTPQADVLWGTFLKHPQCVLQVVDHAAEIKEATGRIYLPLYEKCMTYWLRKDARVAADCHHRMLVKLRLRRLPLRKLAQTMQSTLRNNTRALSTFMDIYRTSNERDLYDDIVPMLCDQGHIELARRWHSMCSHRNDLPSDAVRSHPVVQLFVAEASPVVSPNAGGLTSDQGTIAKRINLPAGGVRRTKKPKYNRELMRRLTGRDTAPLRFDDSFCARLFATRAFPPASVIKGLVMAGVNEIGPQAVRQMGLSAEYPEELPGLFRQLKGCGIALQACVFSIALEKFSTDGRFALVRSMLDSDQHPDVFNDAETQRKLLDFYLGQRDWQQAHRTLAVLSLFHHDSNSASWNILLQARIRQFNPPQIVQVLKDMGERDIVVDDESMRAIRAILGRRTKGHKPRHSSRGKFDDLRFVARCYILILQSGIGMIYPIAWREIIRRFGMLGRLRELKRLLFWLLAWYAPRNNVAFQNLAKPPFLETATAKLRKKHPEPFYYFNTQPWFTQDNSNHPIRQLFPQSLLQGIIVWGFRASLLPNASLEQSILSRTASKKHFRTRFLRKGLLNRLHWSVGLETVVQLRDLGVHVHRDTVTKALQMQFVVLFGHGRSSKVENQIMEECNRIPYAEYVQKANEIWGSTLIEPSGRLWRKHAWSPRALRTRGVQRESWAKLDELVGSGWRQARTATEPDALSAAGLGTDTVADEERRSANKRTTRHHATSAHAHGNPGGGDIPKHSPPATESLEPASTPTRPEHQPPKSTLTALEELMAASKAGRRRS